MPDLIYLLTWYTIVAVKLSIVSEKSTRIVYSGRFRLGHNTQILTVRKKESRVGNACGFG